MLGHIVWAYLKKGFRWSQGLLEVLVQIGV
jgi:hypothetical protein